MEAFEEAYQKAIKENSSNAGETFARSMFEAGTKWMKEKYPVMNVPPCAMPEENFHSLQAYSGNIFKETKLCVIFYTNRDFDIAYREWTRDDPVWRWRTYEGKYVKDSDVMCWMGKML